MDRIGSFIIAGLVVLSANIVGSGHACAEQGPQPSWFQLDKSLAGDWEVVEIPGDAQSLLLRLHGEAGGSPIRHLLSLQSRSSSAYDVALSETVRVLEQKHVSADILVVKYDDDERLAQTAISRAEQNKFDMILATGSEATAWLWKNYQGGRLPVVSICSKDPVALHQAANYEAGTGTNFALTSLNLPADVLMAYLLNLKPNLRNLAVIVDGGNISAIETQAIPITAQARAHGIRVLNLSVQSNAMPGASDEGGGFAVELNRLVANAVEAMRLNDANLENSLFLVTGSTAVFQEMGGVNAHASRVPVVSMVPELVKAGTASAVLSIGVSFRSNAFLAAVYAASILDGRQHVGNLKVGVVAPPDIAINFRRAREIGLKMPFNFFESASLIYDNEDKPVRTSDASEK